VRADLLPSYGAISRDDENLGVVDRHGAFAPQGASGEISVPVSANNVFGCAYADRLAEDDPGCRLEIQLSRLVGVSNLGIPSVLLPQPEDCMKLALPLRFAPLLRVAYQPVVMLSLLPAPLQISFELGLLLRRYRRGLEEKAILLYALFENLYQFPRR